MLYKAHFTATGGLSRGDFLEEIQGGGCRENLSSICRIPGGGRSQPIPPRAQAQTRADSDILGGGGPGSKAETREAGSQKCLRAPQPQSHRQRRRTCSMRDLTGPRRHEAGKR